MSTWRSQIAGRTILWDVAILVSGAGVPVGEAGQIVLRGSSLTWSPGPLRVGLFRAAALDPSNAFRDELYTSGSSATITLQGDGRYWTGRFVAGAGKQSSRYDQTSLPVLDITFSDIHPDVEDGAGPDAPATLLSIILDLTSAASGANVTFGLGWLPGDLAAPSGQDAPHVDATRFRGALLERDGEIRSRGDVVLDVLRLYSAELWRSTVITGEFDVGTWYVWQRHRMGEALATSTRAGQRYDDVDQSISEQETVSLPTIDLSATPRSTSSEARPRWPSIELTRVIEANPIETATTVTQAAATTSITASDYIPIGTEIEVGYETVAISRTVRDVSGAGPYVLELGEPHGDIIDPGSPVLARPVLNLILGGLFRPADVDVWEGSWTRDGSQGRVGDGCAHLATGSSYIEQSLCRLSPALERDADPIYFQIHGTALIAGSGQSQIPVTISLTQDDGTVLYYSDSHSWTEAESSISVRVTAGSWRPFGIRTLRRLPAPGGLLRVRFGQAGASTRLDALGCHLYTFDERWRAFAGDVPLSVVQGGYGQPPSALPSVPLLSASVAGQPVCEAARPGQAWQPVASWAIEEDALNLKTDLSAIAAQQLLAERALDDEALRLVVLGFVEPGTAFLLGGKRWIWHPDESVRWDLVEERCEGLIVAQLHAYGGG